MEFKLTDRRLCSGAAVMKPVVAVEDSELIAGVLENLLFVGKNEAGKMQKVAGTVRSSGRSVA